MIDLKFQMMAQSIDAKFDKMLAALKPSGDTNPQIAALNEKIRDLEKKTETNSILNFVVDANKQNIQLIQDSNKTLVETLKQNKNKGGVEDLKETLESLGLVRKWKKEDREEEWEERNRFMPPDMPLVEKPFWQGVVTGIIDFVKDLNKDGLLTQKLSEMKNPPVLPQPGKKYTPEEEDAIIKREVEEAMVRHKMSLTKPEPDVLVKTGTAVTATQETTTAPVATQAIPAGETQEEFAAKKKVMNAMLELLNEEMILCPRESDWIGFALAKLPDDILIAIRDAVEFPGIFAVMEKYADAPLVSDIKNKVSVDAATVEKKKATWFANGFNILKAEITELLKPVELKQTPPAVSTVIPAGGISAAGTTSTVIPGGTVIATQ